MIDVPVLSIDVSKSKSMAALFKGYQQSLSKPFVNDNVKVYHSKAF